MKVKFWGTRGSIPVSGKDTSIYGGNTTCLEVTLESGRTVIIDAGTGIRELGEKMNSEGKVVDIHLLVTHIHWDHVMGFPFFAPVYESTSRIFIDGYPTCMKGLRVLFDNKMGDGFFPVQFDDLKATIQYLDTLNHGSLSIDDVVVDSIPLQHPQGGYGFRLQEGKKKLVFITDNELTEEAWAGRHPEDYLEFCKGADILIHDAQYSPEEREKRRGWGHSDCASVVDFALKAQVKQLILFHHDPSRKDADVDSFKGFCKKRAREDHSDIVIDAAREDGELML
jgi:phosphoribosyl 1,2-cyclic phosphodiesterase